MPIANIRFGKNPLHYLVVDIVYVQGSNSSIENFGGILKTKKFLCYIDYFHHM